MHNMLATAARIVLTRADGITVARADDCMLSIASTAVPMIAAKLSVREYRLGVNHV
jgi:hypothetical protein